MCAEKGSPGTVSKLNSPVPQSDSSPPPPSKSDCPQFKILAISDCLENVSMQKHNNLFFCLFNDMENFKKIDVVVVVAVVVFAKITFLVCFVPLERGSLFLVMVFRSDPETVRTFSGKINLVDDR